MIHRRLLLTSVLLAGLATGCVQGESGAAPPAPGELRLDYAYYNPLSLVIRDQRWLEDELKGTKVTWVLSAGSNKANENLRAETIDVGSTAGAAALQARANGTPIRTIGVYTRPEWTALVVAKGSSVTGVEQLKGRKVAATKGTDPYFFLLQALEEAGLGGTDVEVVNLQHADGRTALERGDVDAWAGLDPLMAQSQVDAGSKLVYRNPAFNSYGFLNAREAFLAEQPDLAQKVIDAYERARAWVAAHPDEAVRLLAAEAKLAPEVAAVVLKERTETAISPVPGAEQRAVLERILPTLVRESQVRSEQEARAALDSLFEPRFAEKAQASS
ncbi:sulfonate transport system substrate-binding protein [Nonomuraea thailandensis]|uniref:Putative aliphatic sulfonates-binding protein n=1 Tax=Nonomuraea thailandensis TaxID=1188745 RepID=A0A9X2GC67_9ACTN|nr:aliphatic sulfonate ABC transporter substrate-binding protein [Nonomuraea thailandensis]MCP2356241.1 sulfonate transport system substrate-binding protein [Nonomuraea thailandensis]